MNETTNPLRVAFFLIALLMSIGARGQNNEDAGIIIINPDDPSVIHNVIIGDFDPLTGDIINLSIHDGTHSSQVIQKIADQMNSALLENPRDLGEKLSDLQNLIDEEMLKDIKIKLNAADDEWAILLPKLKKLLAARQKLPSSGDFSSLFPKQTPVRKTALDLKTLLDNPKSSNVVILASLAEYRKASSKAAEEYARAQKEISDVLTPRQEAILVDLGYMK
jgi:hypothetical protein